MQGVDIFRRSDRLKGYGKINHNSGKDRARGPTFIQDVGMNPFNSFSLVFALGSDLVVLAGIGLVYRISIWLWTRPRAATPEVAKLRSASPEDRRSLALALVARCDDLVVAELKSMVEGRRRCAFLFKAALYYDYQDALTGVMALGQTGRSDALVYLRHLSTPATTFWTECRVSVPAGDTLEDTSHGEVTTFPNVPSSAKLTLGE